MPFNPCGHIVEYLREAVVDVIRPFRDTNLTVRRRWYRVSESAPPLGFPTAFGSAQWEPFPWLPRNVGEVYPTEPEYRKPAKFLGFVDDHVCGTQEDFQLGAVFNPTLRVVYDSDWFPECCRRLPMCVFNLCSLITLNEAPASQFLTYTVPHQDAAPGTPFVIQQWANNLDGVEDPRPGFITQYHPQGSAGLAKFLNKFSALADGTESKYVLQVGEPVDGPQVRLTMTPDSFTVQVMDATDIGTFTLSLVGGVLEVGGTNVKVAPAALPSGLVRTEGTIAAGGTDQATATAITTDAVEATGATATNGVRLPDKTAGIVYVWNSDTVEMLNVYPPSGARIGIGATDAAYGILALGVTAFARITPTDWTVIDWGNIG